MNKSRNRKEIKGKVTSVRLSSEQHKTIQEKADAADMTLSNFIVTAAMNNNAVTPEILVEMQDIVNFACSEIEKTNPEKVVILQERMYKLWQKSM